MITNVRILCQLSPDLQSTFSTLNYDFKEALFFDIETTGLSPKTSYVFLIGLISFNSQTQNYELIQFLSEHGSEEEEKELLEAFYAFAQTRKLLIHFNGNSFDIPYLTYKFQKQHITNPLSGVDSLDIYRELLSMPAFFRQMPNHKQKSFEDLTQYPRKDLLSGKEMIKIYQNYAKTASHDKEELLLQHNYDDLKGMLSIFPLLNLKQLPKKELEISNIEELEKQASDNHKSREVLLTLTSSIFIPARLSAALSFCYITAADHLIKIKLPLYEGTLKYYYPDYKNYYYLPLEDEAVHKSVAIYTDSEHRQKATASNCYKKYTGIFVYAPQSSPFPLLKEDFRSKESYTFWPFMDSSPTALKCYISEILKTAITTK